MPANLCFGPKGAGVTFYTGRATEVPHTVLGVGGGSAWSKPPPGYLSPEARTPAESRAARRRSL